MQSVLVVEDEAIIAMDLAFSLEAMGYRVIGPAATCEEACRLAREDRPDLLLMDVSIQGGTDGIDTARFITDEMKAAVVFLTAEADALTRSRAAALQPKAFLSKPCSTRQMQSVLESALA
ncbi:response regulator [Terrihabitans sp. B22-R8]|uniref:response regulator n=1 Tax=Terrihabitans sp. B22-R8 TaxID=3425128 RepID=UPI00403D1D59